MVGRLWTPSMREGCPVGGTGRCHSDWAESPLCNTVALPSTVRWRDVARRVSAACHDRPRPGDGKLRFVPAAFPPGMATLQMAAVTDRWSSCYLVLPSALGRAALMQRARGQLARCRLTARFCCWAALAAGLPAGQLNGARAILTRLWRKCAERAPSRDTAGQ